MKKLIPIIILLITILCIAVSASEVSTASLNSSCSVDGVASYYALGYQNYGSNASIYASTTFTGCNEAIASDVFYISAQASCYYYYNSAPYTYYSFSALPSDEPEIGNRVVSEANLPYGRYLKTVGNIYEAYCASCKIGANGNEPGSII